MVPTHVLFPEDEKRRAEERAKKQGISLSEYVRGAVRMRMSYEDGYEAGWRARGAELEQEAERD